MPWRVLPFPAQVWRARRKSQKQVAEVGVQSCGVVGCGVWWVEEVERARKPTPSCSGVSCPLGSSLRTPLSEHARCVQELRRRRRKRGGGGGGKSPCVIGPSGCWERRSACSLALSLSLSVNTGKVLLPSSPLGYCHQRCKCSVECMCVSVCA